MSKKGNFNINDDMKITTSSTKVTCNGKIIVFFPGGKKEELNVKIEADFKDLKAEHHQIFLQSFSSKYNHHTTVIGKVVERKSLWKQIRELFKPKQRR